MVRAGRGDDLLLLVKSLLLVPGGQWIDAPYWTLGCEIGFYASVMLWMRFAGGRLDRFAVGLAFGSLLFWCLYYLEKHWSLRLGVSVFAGLKVIPVYYGPYFAAGMLLFLRKAGRADAVSGAALAACLVSIVLESSLWVAHPANRSFVPTAIVLAGLAAIATAAPSAEVDRWARRCGLVTYPLYLIHFALGLVAMKLLVWAGLGGLPAAVATLLTLIGLSYVVALRAEPAVRRPLRRLNDLFGTRLGLALAPR